MQLVALTQKAAPSIRTDGTHAESRLTHYGEQLVTPVGGSDYAVAMEGGYYAFTHTFNVALQMGAQTAFSETTSCILILVNTNGPRGKDIYIDYVRFFVSGAATGSTSCQFAFQLDNVNRYVGGGSLGTNLNNRNIGANSASGASIRAGASITTLAPSQARKLGGPIVARASIPVANDEYLFNFGVMDTVVNAPSASANPVSYVKGVGPAYLPAGGNNCFMVHCWQPGLTVSPSALYEVGWWER